MSPVLYDLWAKNGFYLFKELLKEEECIITLFKANKA